MSPLASVLRFISLRGPTEFPRRRAILDCGIYDNTSAYGSGAGHPDINGKVVFHENLTSSPFGADDFCNHGTHVAGIAAANTNNSIGVAGAGYNTALFNIKVLDDTGAGTQSTLIQGIYDAADRGANVINMSLGGSGACLTAMQNAINYAWARNVVIVAAAGNDATATTMWPASCAHVVSVAATDSADSLASFSTRGPWVSVAAPGVSIYSTNYVGGYESLSGSSMAAPFVSGLAGLIWSTSYGTTNESVVSRLLSTADQIPGTGSYWASGRINAAAAVGVPASTFLLTVGRVGIGGGTITSSPVGINCGSICSASFPQNSSVTLTASPVTGSVFSNWGGACSGLGTCTVSLSQAQSVTTTFNVAVICNPRPPVGVTVIASGPGSFQVTIMATGAGNVLESLQFGSATNALIDAGSITGATGNFAVTPPPGTQVSTFFVNRLAAGTATTVPLVVVDRCGSWPTFVGGGASAF